MAVAVVVAYTGPLRPAVEVPATQQLSYSPAIQSWLRAAVMVAMADTAVDTAAEISLWVRSLFKA